MFGIISRYNARKQQKRLTERLAFLTFQIPQVEEEMRIARQQFAEGKCGRAAFHASNKWNGNLLERLCDEREDLRAQQLQLEA